jgi:hypothetical protein
VLAVRAFVSLKITEYDTKINDVLWMELQSDSSSSMENNNKESRPAVASQNRVQSLILDYPSYFDKEESNVAPSQEVDSQEDDQIIRPSCSLLQLLPRRPKSNSSSDDKIIQHYHIIGNQLSDESPEKKRPRMLLEIDIQKLSPRYNTFTNLWLHLNTSALLIYAT